MPTEIEAAALEYRAAERDRADSWAPAWLATDRVNRARAALDEAIRRAGLRLREPDGLDVPEKLANSLRASADQEENVHHEAGSARAYRDAADRVEAALRSPIARSTTGQG